ncbi:hypothetical protein DXT91_10365 [Agrobacterium tumefaciens]|uniref:hypothetical protein n=1 Tax=Agrobacterium tumefaciens TaxID=358 RepID=UPI0012B7405E|nr:hypothetical protein [Agrobacterium tumefaciens]MQB04532.1 hypothetical protein [Agrobacterium tumefaciens]
MPLDIREREIMGFLHQHVFDPILSSSNASPALKSGVRLTIVRLERRSAEKMVQYYWNAIIGTERSVGFSARMRAAGFTRFEETIDEFRQRFDPPPSPRLKR